MYAAPPEITAEVFSRVPDELRWTGEPNDWVKASRPGQRLHSFLEGPSFDRDGAFYCVDVPYGRIFKVTPDGRWSLEAQYHGEPNGLKIHRDGRIFIADHHNGIMVMKPGSGVVEPFCTRAGLEPFKGCNDLFFASNGDLYFTDPGRTHLANPTGRVFRIRNGTTTPELLIDNAPYPNGIVLNREETHVLVGVTRDNAVWRFLAFCEQNRQMAGTFIRLSGGYAGPDGLAVDEDGGVAVVHAQFGSVWLFDPWGEPVLRIRSPAGRALTNLAWGGADGKTLFILDAETGSILKARTPKAGRKMFSHM